MTRTRLKSAEHQKKWFVLRAERGNLNQIRPIEIGCKRSTRRMSVVLLLALTLNGCIFVPLIDAFKKQGLTESDRQALLPNDLKKFHDTLSHGSVPGALKYATNDARMSLAKQLEEVGETEKVVDAKVANVEFVESSYKALADISVRYFKIPYYVVHTRKERQEWVFSVSDGWKIASRTVKDEILKR